MFVKDDVKTFIGGTYIDSSQQNHQENYSAGLFDYI